MSSSQKLLDTSDKEEGLFFPFSLLRLSQNKVV